MIFCASFLIENDLLIDLASVVLMIKCTSLFFIISTMCGCPSLTLLILVQSTPDSMR